MPRYPDDISMAATVQQEVAGLRAFSIRPVTADLVGQAFPVVQAAAPDVTLEQWRAFATNPPGENGMGLVGVFNEQDYIVGLFAYRREPHLQHGRILRICHLAAVDLVDSEPVLQALLQAIEDQAKAQDCSAILMATPASYLKVAAHWMHPLFAARGYLLDSTQIRKMPSS